MTPCVQHKHKPRLLPPQFPNFVRPELPAYLEVESRLGLCELKALVKKVEIRNPDNTRCVVSFSPLCLDQFSLLRLSLALSPRVYEVSLFPTVPLHTRTCAVASRWLHVPVAACVTGAAPPPGLRNAVLSAACLNQIHTQPNSWNNAAFHPDLQTRCESRVEKKKFI